MGHDIKVRGLGPTWIATQNARKAGIHEMLLRGSSSCVYKAFCGSGGHSTTWCSDSLSICSSWRSWTSGMDRSGQPRWAWTRGAPLARTPLAGQLSPFLLGTSGETGQGVARKSLARPRAATCLHVLHRCCCVRRLSPTVNSTTATRGAQVVRQCLQARPRTVSRAPCVSSP